MTDVTVVDQSLNICTEIVKSMNRLEFREESIADFTATDEFKEANELITMIEDFDTVGVVTDDLLVQRTLVIVMFNILFSSLDKYPSSQLRRAMTIVEAPDEFVALLDQHILPFVKGYENDYFPRAQ